MKNLNLTDHQISALINKHNLKLRSSEGVTLVTNYYNNDDFSFELLVIINNSTGEKQIYSCESDSIYNIQID